MSTYSTTCLFLIALGAAGLYGHCPLVPQLCKITNSKIYKPSFYRNDRSLEHDTHSLAHQCGSRTSAPRQKALQCTPFATGNENEDLKNRSILLSLTTSMQERIAHLDREITIKMVQFKLEINVVTHWPEK